MKAAIAVHSSPRANHLSTLATRSSHNTSSPSFTLLQEDIHGKRGGEKPETREDDESEAHEDEESKAHEDDDSKAHEDDESKAHEDDESKAHKGDKSKTREDEKPEARSTAASQSRDTPNVLVPLLILIPCCAAVLFTLARPAAELPAEFARYAAEFVGTFVLVFTVACCVLVGSAVWNALAIGCVLMVMVYATGPVSGGNLNPAVSLALGLAGALDWADVVKYWVAQIAAGLAAASLADALFPSKMVGLAPVAPFLGCHAMVAEMIYTFMLCFVVLNCAASRRNNSARDGNQFYGLAIGFVIVAGGYAVGGISGAAFNPAVAVGFDFRRLGFGWGIWYALFEAAGAALAAIVFHTVRPEEKMSGDAFAGYTALLPTKIVSEFLGVFILVLTVGLNLVTGSPATAFSAAAALMCMIYSLGDVSGAHFNPAVTLAAVARGACPAGEGAALALAQTFAGVFAGLFAALFHVASDRKDITFYVQPGAGYSVFTAGFMELFFTFVLAYIVLAVATTKPPPSQITRQNFYFALCIGSCVTAGGFAIGAVSGGQLNPAVSAGVAILGGMSPGSGSPLYHSYLVVFVIMELLGGLCAAIVFHFTHPKERNASVPMEFASFACEFVGTFALVFTVGCCALASDSPTWNATAIGSVLMVMIYATGPVSGGNLNPAVSFALGLTGDLKWPRVFQYWIAQLLAGVSASTSCIILLSPRAPALHPIAPFSWVHAMMAEAIYTFMLCFVVLSCAVSKRNNPPTDGNQFFALAIGFVIIAGGYAVGDISGAAFNPAVAVGLDIRHMGFTWGLVWTVAELAGAAVAAAVHMFLRPEERLSAAERDAYAPSLRTRCMSEFLGTFMLVLTVGLNIVMGSPAIAWSAAAALMCMIYSLGDVSGGHFNPAVTLAVVVSDRGKCSPLDGFAFVVSQLLAGVLAGLVVAGFHAAGKNHEKTYPLRPGEGHDLLEAGLCELFFTFVLAYVVLAVATARPPPSQLTKRSFHFALAIGSCVTAGGVAVGAVSGAALNPAVALGVATQALSFGNFIPFALWELTGGLLAAIVFRMTHPFEFKSMPSMDIGSIGSAGKLLT